MLVHRVSRQLLSFSASVGGLFLGANMADVGLLQWAGCATGVLGSMLLAWRSRWSGWGFVVYLLSNAFWIAFGIATRAPGLVVMQGVFTVTSAVGIWRWLLVPGHANVAVADQ